MSKSCSKTPLHWAAPSWVIPGTAAANALFLADKAPAICLCLFESAPCLAYGPDDLPQDAGGIRWHLHLPVDLPWQAGPEAAADVCRQLAAKMSYLHPELAVLHAPEGGSLQERSKTLARFAQIWDSAIPIALENTSHCDILELGRTFLADNNFLFCLDAAHVFNYGQLGLLASSLPEQADLWHWSAPGDGDRHWPLTRLAEQEQHKARELLARAKPDALHLLEVFSWDGVLASLAVLSQWQEEAAEGK